MEYEVFNGKTTNDIKKAPLKETSSDGKDGKETSWSFDGVVFKRENLADDKKDAVAEDTVIGSLVKFLVAVKSNQKSIFSAAVRNGDSPSKAYAYINKYDAAKFMTDLKNAKVP